MRHYYRIYNKMKSEGSKNIELMNKYQILGDSLDRILGNKKINHLDAKQKFEITWDKIRSNLQSQESAIEFTRYYDYEDTTFKYLALIIKANCLQPQAIPLGNERDIRLAIRQKRFSDLYNLIWRDIDTLLTGVKTVYYSPAGELNNVAFSALYSKNTDNNNVTYLIDKYSLHQLTTTRYLADGTLKKTKDLKNEITLFGGINYDTLPAREHEVDTTHSQSNENYVFEINLEKQKEIKGSRNTTFSSGMPYLNGTKSEVDNISALMKQNGWKVEKWSETHASEKSLKTALQKNNPGIIHIATHGFAFA
jgi:hypothetical protein